MKPEPIYRERLLRLAAFLEELPPERFDYSDWVGRDWAGAPDLSCGTTACALGWATTIPEFRDLGLRLMNNGVGSIELSDNEDSDYVEASMHVFGLEKSETLWLFLSAYNELGEDTTAIEVAKHIRQFVEYREREFKHNEDNC